MITKRTFKNQVTLPKEVLKNFPNVDYFDVSAREGEIVLRPVSVTPSAERASFSSRCTKPVTRSF